MPCPVNGIEVLSDGWDHWYEPPNFRISLGCYPRGDSFVGIIYLRPGDIVRFGDLSASVRWANGPVAEVELRSPDGWLAGLYRAGEPVRYSSIPRSSRGCASSPCRAASCAR